MIDPQKSSSFNRREFIGAFIVGIGSLILILSLWLIARDAPSATRDPNMTPPALVPTPGPPPVVTPTATPGFSPYA